MLENIFLKILNMSFIGSFVILFVMLIRLFLKKSPKIFSYLLWGVVLFRLLCPFSFESIFSLLPAKVENIADNITYSQSVSIQNPQILGDITPPEIAANGAVLTQPSLSDLCSVIWIIGAAILVIYGVMSFINTKKRLSSSKCDRENIYTCEGLTTPLVVGLIKPKIYLPQHLTGKEKEYILLHEQTHIKHFDPFVKILSFATVCLHWFNPLVWLAYFASEKDMEMCCDEAVIEEIGYDIKKNYSYSLLNFATGRQIIGGMPLAFGEGDTKSRVKNILNYKKPAFWVIVVSTIAIVAVGVGLMTNSASEPIVSPYVQEYIPGQGNIRGNVDVESYEKISPDFAVGAEKYGVAVFKNPHKAFETFEVLYAEGIAYIQKENDLRPLSKNYYEAYKTYGWQMTSGTKEELAQAKFVSGFLDIYENSFLKQSPNTENTHSTSDALSPLDYFIMTDEIGAIGCEYGVNKDNKLDTLQMLSMLETLDGFKFDTDWASHGYIKFVFNNEQPESIFLRYCANTDDIWQEEYPIDTALHTIKVPSHIGIYNFFADITWENGEQETAYFTLTVAEKDKTAQPQSDQGVSIEFPAYGGRTQANAKIFDIKPFKLNMSLPFGWTVRVKGEADIKYPLIGGWTPLGIYNADDICVGAVGYNIFDGEIADYKNPMTIYNQIALGNNYSFNASPQPSKDGNHTYFVISEDKSHITATTEVYYSKTIAKDFGYGDKEVTNRGILSCDKNRLVYIAIELDSALVSEYEQLSMAKSIKISDV